MYGQTVDGDKLAWSGKNGCVPVGEIIQQTAKSDNQVNNLRNRNEKIMYFVAWHLI
jgi:hypothetical protein